MYDVRKCLTNSKVVRITFFVCFLLILGSKNTETHSTCYQNTDMMFFARTLPETKRRKLPRRERRCSPRVCWRLPVSNVVRGHDEQHNSCFLEQSHRNIVTAKKNRPVFPCVRRRPSMRRRTIGSLQMYAFRRRCCGF